MTALTLTPLEAQRLESHVRQLEARVAELTKRESLLLREVEALRARVSGVVSVARREPAISIYCDVPQCNTPPLTRDVAPPEDAIPQWVRGLGWVVDGDRYVCPECARLPAGQVHVERKD